MVDLFLGRSVLLWEEQHKAYKHAAAENRVLYAALRARASTLVSNAKAFDTEVLKIVDVDLAADDSTAWITAAEAVLQRLEGVLIASQYEGECDEYAQFAEANWARACDHHLNKRE